MFFITKKNFKKLGKIITLLSDAQNGKKIDLIEIVTHNWKMTRVWKKCFVSLKLIEFSKTGRYNQFLE